MSLLTDLYPYWKLDESSGTRVDSNLNNDLTVTGSVGSAAGIINNGASFPNTSADFLHITDNTDLSLGNADAAITLWVKLNAKAARQNLSGKVGGSNASWYFAYSFGSDVFFAGIYGSAAFGDETTVLASNLGSPSTGVWYFVVLQYDATADLWSIQVNNGTANTAAHTLGFFDDSGDFFIGDWSGGNPADATIDEMGIWKRKLSSTELTQLYNGGAGLSYDNFGGAVTGYLLVKN